VQVIHHIAALRAALAGQRDVVFVPTMGGLHEGHASLIKAAVSAGGPVVASVFVNRLQFAPAEDFSRYPRSLEQDAQLLSAAGCDFLFAPSEHELYPEPQSFKVQPPSELATILEGSTRPDFFTGVCTVVLKLLGIVTPAKAVFGKKDYQQLLLVRAMVRQMALPVDIIAVDTVRDQSGLALSSRNSYLSESERIEAAQLHGLLQEIAVAVRTRSADRREIEAHAIATLVGLGFKPDYVAIRRRSDLMVAAGDEPLVVLAAATLGTTRLIDNLEI
jgi:pantoate--beta-alanine ligase